MNNKSTGNKTGVVLMIIFLLMIICMVVSGYYLISGGFGIARVVGFADLFFGIFLVVCYFMAELLVQLGKSKLSNSMNDISKQDNNKEEK